MQKQEGATQQADRVTLVCFALEEEAAPFRKMTEGKGGVSILITGIGRTNSERSLRAFLAANSPGLVLTSGFAGGLNPELKIGDVIFLAAWPALDRVLVRLGARPATFLSAPRIATTAVEKEQLRRSTGADAVDMESEAIQAVCGARGIPCATVRAVSDTAGENLPLDFNELAKPDMSLDWGKLALALAKSPGAVGALLRLRKNCRFAAKKLAEVLAGIIAGR